MRNSGNDFTPSCGNVDANIKILHINSGIHILQKLLKNWRKYQKWYGNNSRVFQWILEYSICIQTLNCDLIINYKYFDEEKSRGRKKAFISTGGNFSFLVPRRSQVVGKCTGVHLSRKNSLGAIYTIFCLGKSVVVQKEKSNTCTYPESNQQFFNLAERSKPKDSDWESEAWEIQIGHFLF